MYYICWHITWNNKSIIISSYFVRKTHAVLVVLQQKWPKVFEIVRLPCQEVMLFPLNQKQ